MNASFQERVQPWLLTCFGPEISNDLAERNRRFLEEALELVQACHCPSAVAHQLVDYVYARPPGDRTQEVGGVMVTLAALCLAQGMDMRNAGEDELIRIWSKLDEIRAKHAAKPKHIGGPRRIYVASSWRNPLQPEVVRVLRDAGHYAYDFRNPKPGDKGFGWTQLGLGDWRTWSAEVARDALQLPVAQAGFRNDHEAMEWADTFVMVLPCGRSAHLELGWACGAGKRTLILQTEPQEPELMYLEAERICVSIDEVLGALAS